ncbi:hypothetical protein [Microbacterium lacticum]
MATFTDPRADAAEAAEAVRGLAHALRADDQPRDLYDVLGEVLLLTRRLTDVSGQLAARLERHRPLAADDDGNRENGASAVDEAVQRLAQATAHIDLAETAIGQASEAASRIAWKTTATRYVGVVFLQGEDADRVLDTIDQHGPDEAVDHLTGYDFGDETDGAALENGDVHEDAPPTSRLDRTATHRGYTIVYNADLGYVGLYRPLDTPPDPDLRPGAHPPVPAARAVAEASATEQRLRRERPSTQRTDRHLAGRAPARGLTR